MAVGIDTSNVVTQGQFKTAIEEYVQQYCAERVQGFHGTMSVQGTASTTSSTTLPVTINLSGMTYPKNHGVINIFNNGTSGYATNKTIALTSPQTQIFVWWQNGSFKYAFSSNNLYNDIIVNGVPTLRQYVDSVKYNSTKNTITFNIMINAPSTLPEYHASQFSIDYHIW